LIVSVVEIALVAVFGLFLLYLALLSALALTARKRSAVRSSKFQRIAVVVPAHNEESSIERTIHSLLAVDYPRESFDVIVVADNCTDRTAEVATNLGGIVYKRHNPKLHGKGYALRWCFDQLVSDKALYQAIVVVDADSVVSRNFLLVMNSYLESGAKVIQSSDLVKPRPGAWSAEVTRVGFTLYNYVRPLGRRVIKCSAGLRGNGMCFATETLRRIPWEAYSIAEDLEYGLMLLLKGVNVIFAPEAVVQATMPEKAENAEAPRARWEVGRFPIIKKYAGELLWTAIRNRSFRVLDAFIDLVTPPLVNLLAVVTIFFFLNLLLWGFGIAETALFVWLWAALFGVAAVHVLVGLYAAEADRSLYKALLHIPRYALWKLGVYGKVLQRGSSRRWIRTARESTTL
jgi:1,2-diacylglycerol 3-beta-glucosyltransferase